MHYKQTAIGVGWAWSRPFLTMVMLSRLANLPSDGVPYLILVFAAMLPWQLFSTALSECSNSLIANANLLSKVYFPHLVVPTSAVVVTFVGFAISGIILVALMVWFAYVPGWRIVTLPLFTLIALAASRCKAMDGIVNVQYRDFRYIVPFLVQFGLCISPVGFSSIVPEQWRLLYSLNSMVGVDELQAFRLMLTEY